MVREDVFDARNELEWYMDNKAMSNNRHASWESSESDSWHDNDEYRERDNDPWADEDDYLKFLHHGVWPDESKGQDDYRLSEEWPTPEDYRDTHDTELDLPEKDSSDSSDHDSPDLYDVSLDYDIDNETVPSALDENETTSSDVDESPDYGNYPQYANYGDDYFSALPKVTDDNDDSDEEPHTMEPDSDKHDDTRDDQYEYDGQDYDSEDWKDYDWPTYGPDYNGDYNQQDKASEGDGNYGFDSGEADDNYYGNTDYPDSPANYVDKLDSSTTTEKPDTVYKPDDAFDWNTLMKDHYGDDANYDASYETDYNENTQANDTAVTKLYEDMDETKPSSNLSSLMANDTGRQVPYEDTDAMKTKGEYPDYNIDLPIQVPHYPNSDYDYGEYQDDDIQNNQYPGYYDEPQDSLPNYNGDGSTLNPLYPDPYDDSEGYGLYPSLNNDGDYETNNDTTEYYDESNYDDFNETDTHQNLSDDNDTQTEGTVGEILVDDEDILSDDNNRTDSNTLDDVYAPDAVNFSDTDATVGDKNEYQNEDQNEQTDYKTEPINEDGVDNEPLYQDSEEQEYNYLNDLGKKSESQIEQRQPY